MRVTSINRFVIKWGPEYFTVQGIAEYLDVHPVTVRKWVMSGGLKAVARCGATMLYRGEDVETIRKARRAR